VLVDNNTAAIVAATFLGPILAVVISLWRENRREKRDARMRVFGTLMASRGSEIHVDSVRALNSVQVAFSHDEHVLDAWRDLMEHVELPTAATPEWGARYQTFLLIMLSAMARDLGMRDLAQQIRNGRFRAYAPRGWGEHEKRIIAAYEYVGRLAEKTAAVPVAVVYTAPPGTAPMPNAVPEPSLEPAATPNV
jgi:hypothetical protein